MQRTAGPTSSAAPQQGSWYGRTVVGLGAVSFLTDLHSEAILALLPQFMASALGMPMAAIGFVEGLAQATVAALQMAAGFVSDRFGVRKPLVLCGYALSTVVKVLLALVTRPWQVLAVRVGDRAGKGLRTPPRDALLADAVQISQWGKAYGLHRALDSAGAIAGTAFAWAVFARTASYRLTFAWAALAGVAAIFALLFFVSEPPRSAAPSHPRFSLGGLPAHFWWFVAGYAIFSFANVTYAFFLLRCKELGIAEAWVPAVYLLHNVVYTAAGLPAGVVADRLGARLATVLTLLLHAALCFGLALTSAAAVAVAVVALYGVVLAGDGSAVRALAAELLPAELRASGIAVYRTLGGLATLPGSWLVGWWWDRRGGSEAWLLAGTAAVLALPFLAAPLRRR